MADEMEVGEEIYNQQRESLEKKYFGKVVAIDTDKGEIAGVGNSILSAAKEAKRKYPEKTFYFKRVGYPYTEHLLVF